MSNASDQISAITKDYSRERVPLSARYSAWSIFVIWIAGIISLPIMMVGVQVGQALSFQETIIATLIGQAILSVIAGLAAYIGSTINISTAMITRLTFGRYGGDLIAIALGLALLGWFGVQAEVFAQSLQRMIMDLFDVTIPVYVLTIIGGTLMSATAIIGIKALNILSQIAAPLLVLILIIPILISGNGVVEAIDNFVPNGKMNLGTAISIIVGSWAVGASVTADFSRFAKTPKQGVVSTVAAFLIGGPVLLLLSALLALVSGHTDFVDIMYFAGLGIPALVVLMLATWTTNDTNLYLSSLSFTGAIKVLKKWQVATFSGVIGITAATLGITGFFIEWLLFLGVFFPPMAGVFTVAFFFNRSRYMADNLEPESKLDLPMITAWGIASYIGYLTSFVESITLSGIPALDAYASAIILTFALCAIKHRRISLSRN